MSDEIPFHVFYVKPMPGVGGSGRVVVSDEETHLLILLPDDSQLVITADRAVYLKCGYQMILNQWQMSPSEYDEPDLDALPMQQRPLQSEAEEADPVTFERPFGRTKFRA